MHLYTLLNALIASHIDLKEEAYQQHTHRPSLSWLEENVDTLNGWKFLAFSPSVWTYG